MPTKIPQMYIDQLDVRTRATEKCINVLHRYDPERAELYYAQLRSIRQSITPITTLDLDSFSTIRSVLDALLDSVVATIRKQYVITTTISSSKPKPAEKQTSSTTRIRLNIVRNINSEEE